MPPSHDTARRRLVAKLLTAAGPPVDANETPAAAACRKLANQIGQCGAHPSAWIDPSRHRVIRSMGRCGQRHCPSCAAIRAAETAGRVRRYVERMDSLAMVTLTIASTDAPLAKQLDHLVASARRLRQTADWRAHCRGGVQVLEVTYHAASGLWHPHVHILADWRYWDQKLLSAAWARASGGSPVVDVRRVHSREAASRYVSKYVAKAASADAIPAAAMSDWVSGWRSRRRIQPFGALHGVRVREPDLPRDAPLVHAAHLRAVEADAAAGDNTAARILTSLATLPRWPVTDDPDPATRLHHCALCEDLVAWAAAHAQRMSDHESPPSRHKPRRPRRDDPWLPFFPQPQATPDAQGVRQPPDSTAAAAAPSPAHPLLAAPLPSRGAESLRSSSLVGGPLRFAPGPAKPQGGAATPPGPASVRGSRGCRTVPYPPPIPTGGEDKS